VQIDSYLLCGKYYLNECQFDLNPLDSKGNYSATSNNTLLVHWPLMGVTFGTARRGLGGLWACPVPVSLYQM